MKQLEIDLSLSCIKFNEIRQIFKKMTALFREFIEHPSYMLEIRENIGIFVSAKSQLSDNQEESGCTWVDQKVMSL